MTESPDLPDGWRLDSVSEIDSTNAEIMRRAGSGEPEGLAIRADLQTAGRGRRGRAWESPVGNLYLSVLLDAPPQTAGQLGFAAALSLIDGLEADQELPDLRVKWPNDLILGDAKVAGLLLENVPGQDQVVVGLGVNLVPTSVSEAVYPVGTLLLPAADDLDGLAIRICTSLKSWLETWRTVGFMPLRNAWLTRARGIGEFIVVRLPNEEISGRFKDLSSEGALILEQDAEERIIPAGEVFFVPEGGA